jgi:hypothetical protein
MPKWGQELTPTENVGGGFIIHSTLTAQWAVRQPHQVKVSAQHITSGEIPVTTLDCILPKDKSLTLVHWQGPDINSRSCRWLLPTFCQRLQCWFPNQRLIVFLRSCLETPKAGSGPINPEAEPFLASSSAVSLPLTPTCARTQNNPTACRTEILFNASSHWRTNGDVVLTAPRAFRAARLSEQILTCFSGIPWALI